VDGK
jgi:tubulin polyglutamylase TTLL2